MPAGITWGDVGRMGNGEQVDEAVRRRKGGLGRFIALVVAPSCCAFAAWFLPGARHDAHGLLVPSQIAISGLVPLIGLGIAVVYIGWTRDWAQLRPFLPFLLVALIFAGLMVDLALTMPRDESQDAMIPVFEGLSGFLQAWLALGGGLTSFCKGRLDPPRR